MTDNIYERFMALPRARKGATRVVIVEEQVLAELIVDAQVAERALTARVPLPTDGVTTFPGKPASPPMVIHFDPLRPPGPHSPGVTVVEEHRRRARRRQGW